MKWTYVEERHGFNVSDDGDNKTLGSSGGEGNVGVVAEDDFVGGIVDDSVDCWLLD